MDEKQMRGWPLSFLNKCKAEYIVPDRIIRTDQGTILFSWIRDTKFAEIEFGADNISAWTCYVDEVPDEILNLDIGDFEGFGLLDGQIDTMLILALKKIDDFLA